MRKFMLISWVLFGAGVSAQSIQHTVSECIRIALTNNPSLRMAESDVQFARENVKQARASEFISFDFSGSYRRQSTVPEMQFPAISLPFGTQPVSLFPGGKIKLGVLDSYDFRINASQPIFAGFRLSNQRRAAEAGVDGIVQEMRQKRSELVYKVQVAYANVLKAQKFIQIANTTRDQVQTHLRDVENYVEQGMARKDELLRVKVKLSEAELTVLQAQNAFDLAFAALESLLGEKLPANSTFEETKAAGMSSLDIETSYQQALAHRAEVQSIRYTKEAAMIGKKIAKGSWLPSLAVFGSYGYGKPGLNFIKNEWMNYWIVGAGVEWNLWNWGKSRSQVQQAELKSKNMTEAERQLQLAIRLDVTQACLQIDEAAKRFKMTTELEQQAAETYQMVENSYKQGQVTNSEYLDAQLDLTRAQLQKAQAEIDYALAEANWLRSVGKNLEALE